MGIRKKVQKTHTERPLIALHKILVTVRQIFSDDPASQARAAQDTSAANPFPLPEYPFRMAGVLM